MMKMMYPITTMEQFRKAIRISKNPDSDWVYAILLKGTPNEHRRIVSPNILSELRSSTRRKQIQGCIDDGIYFSYE